MRTKPETTLMELVDSCEKSNEFYDDTEEKLARADYLRELGFNTVASEIVDKVTLKDKLNRISEYGYLRITTANIQKFLNKKAELYDAEHNKQAVEPEPQESDVMRMTFMNKLSQYMYNSNLKLESSRQAQQALISGHVGGIKAFIPMPNPLDRYREILTGECSRLSAKTCDYYSGNGIGQYIWSEVDIQKYNAIPPDDVLKTLQEHKSRNIFNYFTIATVNEIKDPLLLGRISGCDDRFFIAQWGKDIALEDVI